MAIHVFLEGTISDDVIDGNVKQIPNIEQSQQM